MAASAREEATISREELVEAAFARSAKQFRVLPWRSDVTFKMAKTVVGPEAVVEEVEDRFDGDGAESSREELVNEVSDD